MSGVELTGMAYWLPLVFAFLMALSMLVYVVMDGFDLGVGALIAGADDAEKDTMIASIGPFWDANETWLVLGVGILLVAFPTAHGVILTSLYLPVALMLCGLILRGVAFDFRVKVRASRKPLWNRIFWVGSVSASLAQGYMLGLYITGFENGFREHLFAGFIALCLLAGYALLGGSWLIMKTEGALQRKSIIWSRWALLLTLLGVAAVSLATPLVSERIFERWFSGTAMLMLAPVPLLTGLLFFACHRSLARLNLRSGDREWVPFACAVGIFVVSFAGLGYSLFPYLVVDRITAWDAASAPESLLIILFGTLFTLPAIIGYTIFSYRVFWGKATSLSYE
ncbi:MAG: cytochrome d ubiquinol oxidase subunit II [Xanthomonadales bacterium]|nr:cytochrome d ubiquinol oxidase subunit II [Xanthomonadales bacterium]